MQKNRKRNRETERISDREKGKETEREKRGSPRLGKDHEKCIPQSVEKFPTMNRWISVPLCAMKARALDFKTAK